jgi:hypothetical protein
MITQHQQVDILKPFFNYLLKVMVLVSAVNLAQD